MNLGAGVLHVLHGTRPVWRNLAEHLFAEFGTALGIDPKPPVRGLGRPGVPDAVREKYLAAYIDFRSGKHRRLTHAAAAHGLTYATWRRWCHDHAAECYAAYDKFSAAHAPILKPGGAIL